MAEDTKAPSPDAGGEKVRELEGKIRLQEDRQREETLIREVCAAYKCGDEGLRWLNEGLTLAQVRGKIEETLTQRAKDQKPAGHLGMSDDEASQFNANRGIMALASGDWHRAMSFEREVSEEIGKRLGKSSGGMYLPLDMKMRASVTGNIVGTSSLGGAAVQTTVLSLIEILRNRLILTRAGATFLTGLTGNITFPRQITANTFNWTGENPTAANTAGSLTLDNVTLSPKTGMVSTAVSRQLIVQSSPDAQALVMNDIMRVVALGVDSAGLNGTGSNNQPTGVRATSNIGNRTLGSAGAALAWADLVGLETDVATANADTGNLAYITNTAVRGKLKQTLKSTTAGSLYLWEGGNDPGTINGYNAFATNQVPSNLTQGTSTTICSSIIFGNWSELLIGEWGGALEIIIDPYTNAGQNMIALHGIAMVDVDVRHPGSFSKSDAVLTS